MNRAVRIFFFLLVTAIMAAACSREPLYDDFNLTILLDIDAPVLTKADQGEISAESDEENAIKDLRIWVFLHEDVETVVNEVHTQHIAGELLGYINPKSNKPNGQGKVEDPLTTYENRYHIKLAYDIAITQPSVDVYAIGNVGSIVSGSLPDGDTSRDELDALLLSGEAFGLKAVQKTEGNSPVTAYVPACTSVPETGLPFSGVGKGLPMKGRYPVLSVEKITLKRAVSKFRFVLSQIRDEVGPMISGLTITDLTFDSGLISQEEYLFNDSNNPYKISNYVGHGVDFLAEKVDPQHPELNYKITNTEQVSVQQGNKTRKYYTLRTNLEPEKYVYSGQSAQAYEELILQGIQDQVLTDWGKCYLRETDKKLTGHISYSLNGVARQPVPFTMEANEDFVRGRSWIVYIYFLREAMGFSVSWSEWGSGSANPLSVTDLTPHEETP